MGVGGWVKLGETLGEAGCGCLRAHKESREVLMLKEAGWVAITAAWLVAKLEALRAALGRLGWGVMRKAWSTSE